ncbi:MAG: hypothetical protein ACRYG2_19620, partial [Janthinobacterium lividum]
MYALNGESGLELTGTNADPIVKAVGGGLSDAFRAAERDHFPASGTTPDELVFSAPQYNTWTCPTRRRRTGCSRTP